MERFLKNQKKFSAFSHKPVNESIVDTLAVAHGWLWKCLFIAGITVRVIVALSVLILLIVSMSVVALVVIIVHVVIKLTACVQRLFILFFVIKSVLSLQVLLAQLSDGSVVVRSTVWLR